MMFKLFFDGSRPVSPAISWRKGNSAYTLFLVSLYTIERPQLLKLICRI